MVRFFKFFVINLLLSLISTAVFADDATISTSVVGYWRTTDGKTGKPSAIIQVERANQSYDGKVVKIFLVNNQKSDDICKTCKGEEKDHPILGLTIIKNMQCFPGYCKGGTILDPRDGKLYHATMKLIKNGEKLKVRGYVGIPLFGKTVVWQRVSGI